MNRARDHIGESAGFSKQVLSLFLAMATAGLLMGDGYPWSLSDSHAAQVATLERIPPGRLPVFEDDLAFDHLAEGIRGSISYFHRLPPTRMFSFGKDRFSAAHMIRSLERFLAFIDSHPSSGRLQAFVRKNFRVYTFVENRRPVQVFFTGYYEPVLRGSLTKTAAYRFPVYPRPSNLVVFNPSDFAGGCPDKKIIGKYTGRTVVPYDSRKNIEKTGAMAGMADPIAWVDNPIDLFFLQVQGSGRIRLENGGMINLHYDISNGLPYRSIGQYLIDHGKIKKERVSMQSIRAYLTAHPEEVQEVLNYNPRYVFFKLSGRGPAGSLGIGLTPGRSIATDQRLCPAGTLSFIRTKKPVVDEAGRLTAWSGFSRFVLGQDTGSAIRGPGRVDIFWGSGEYAELAAGYMKQPGRLYFLILKPKPD